MGMTKKRIISLDLLKLLSMLLIINSHSDVLYPAKISFLASGGSIGNELFFLISGYLFSAKEDIRADLGKRFVRLYLPAYIMLIITGLLGRLRLESLIDVIRVFIWPTRFWFVGAIFLYAAILYWLIGKNISRTKNTVLFTIGVFTLDVLIYLLFIKDKSVWIVEDAYLGFVPYRSIYSIVSFILGYYLKMNKDKMALIGQKAALLTAIISFIGFYGFKLLLNRNIVPMQMQIVSHLITVLCALFIFLCFAKADMNPRLEGTRCGRLISGLAELSLESFLVQFLVISAVAALNISFPLNLLTAVICVLVCAEALHLIDGAIKRAIHF